MMGFGIVGCGKIAERHIATLAKCKGAELAAICDVRKERMDAVEQEYRNRSGAQAPIAKYHSLTDLLTDARVQTTIIATPSAFHADLAKQAIAGGKHVLVEKPLALSLQDAKDIAEAAEQHQVMVQVCHQLRYKPIMQRIKEMIDSGAMGRLYLGVISMRLQRSQAYYEAAPWRGTWEQDGGMLLNQGIHLIDLLQWFMGDYSSIYGNMLRGPLPKQTEDVAAGIVQFKQGGLGIIEANTLTYPSSYENSITLFGEKGTVSVGGMALNEIRKWSIEGVSPEAPDGYGTTDEHLVMYEQFIQAAAGAPDARVIPAAEGRKALELIFALYDSVRAGQPVPAPLTTFSTAMMATMEGWK